MNRRSLVKTLILTSCGLCITGGRVSAKTYLSVEQAKKSLCRGASLKAVDVTLSKAQMKSIKKASKVRVRNKKVRAWKTNKNDWFIVDQIVGKHEFIDIAVALSSSGKVKGIEILQYRESYGDEIMNPKWLAQFIGKGPGKRLKIDREIRNISGATLSSVHVTQGINRLTETWVQVLRHM